MLLHFFTLLHCNAHTPHSSIHQIFFAVSFSYRHRIMPCLSCSQSPLHFPRRKFHSVPKIYKKTKMYSIFGIIHVFIIQCKWLVRVMVSTEYSFQCSVLVRTENKRFSKKKNTVVPCRAYAPNIECQNIEHLNFNDRSLRIRSSNVTHLALI